MDLLGADELVVQGYEACAKCGEWLIAVDRTIALCADCRRDLKALADAGRLRYEVEGRTFTTKARRKQCNPKPQKKTPERVAARKARDRAEMAALMRLRRIYRPMYEMLRDQELIRQGVVPNPRTITPRPKVVADTLLQDLVDAEERETEVAQRLAGGR